MVATAHTVVAMSWSLKPWRFLVTHFRIDNVDTAWIPK